MLSEAPNDPAASLGARVRTLRRERGLTLKALGRRAALSHPFLSQLERGLARPSLGSVERIASALDVPVGDLWAPPPRRAGAQLIRRQDGPVTPHPIRGAPGGVRQLAGEDARLDVREWAGGSRRWPEAHATVRGCVAVHVTRGGLEVDLDGTVHALAEGDTLIFDGDVPHRFRRAGSPSTRALIVTGRC